MRHIVTLSCLGLLATTLHSQFGAGVLLSNEIQLAEGNHKLVHLDLDQDDDLDIVMRLGTAILWLENLDGSGSFGPADTLYQADSIHGFDFADADGDGDLDLVIAEGQGLMINWIENLSGLTFAVTHLIGSNPSWYDIGALLCHDITGDGAPDVLATVNDNYVHWYVNDGGAFAVTDSIQHIGGPASSVLLCGDMDMDGDVDQVTINWNGRISIAQNDDGAGAAWSTGTEVSGFMQMADWGSAPQLLDVDGDGDLDLVDAQNDAIRWARNRLVEDGAWGAFDQVTVANEAFTYGVGWAGSLGCGNGASIVWHSWPWTGAIQWGQFDHTLGAFTAPTSLMDSIRSVHLSAADLNGDGANDLIIADRDSALIWWFPNLLPEEAQANIQFTPFDTLCVLGDPYPLSHAMPAGGAWTGEGAEDNLFTPPGTGTFALAYQVADEVSGCPMVATQFIAVVLEPSLSVVSGSLDECDTAPLQYSASPAGGTWSGIAQPNGIVDRSCAARPDQGEVAYSMNAVNGGGCSTAGDYLVLPGCLTVDLGPDVILCTNGDTLMVSAQGPFQGFAEVQGCDSTLFTPPAYVQGFFYPDHPAGEYIISATVTGGDECPGYDTLIVTLVAPPTVSSTMVEVVDIDGGPVTFDGGSPEGGWFEVDGTTTATVDPITYNIGETIQVIYYYTDPTSGCTGADTAYVLVEQITALGQAVLEQNAGIAPNPARESCTVWFGAGKATITMLDATGRQARSWTPPQSPAQLDVSGLPAGVYYVIVTGTKTDRHRIVLE